MMLSIQDIAIELSSELSKRRYQAGRAEFLNGQVDRGEHHQYTEVERVALELAYGRRYGWRQVISPTGVSDGDSKANRRRIRQARDKAR